MNNTEILKKLLFYEQQIKKPLTDKISQFYRKAFNALIKKINRHSIRYDYESPNDIINGVIEYFNAPEDFATNKTRKREYVSFRQKALTICYHIWGKGYSLSEYGNYFNQDHATVLHAKKTVKNLCETDKQYRKEFEEMQRYFLGSVEI